MLLLRNSINGALRSAQMRRISCFHHLETSSVQSVRWSSTLASKKARKAQNPAITRSLFPERLLIYHAGTARTVFLGCLKVTTIFIFGFFSLVVIPAHVFTDEKVYWVTATAISGIVPMVFVAYTTSPFVAYIHLRIPHFARNSKELVLRYSKSLPREAELDITTMNFIGKPRVARMRVKDISPAQQRFGLTNFVRDTTEINMKRPWWRGKVISQFGVHGPRSGSLNGEIWELVKLNINKQSKRRLSQV